MNDLIPVCVNYTEVEHHRLPVSLLPPPGSFENGEGVAAGIRVLLQTVNVFGCPTDT